MKMISTQDCKILVNSEENILIDIREHYELDNCSVKNAKNIAMAEVVQHLDLIKSYTNVILMCHSGKRAAALGNYLHTEYKLNNILVLEGGIAAYLNLAD